MILSMTGYGKAEAHIGTRKYTVELRSLNGKGLDLSVRMPPQFREKEMGLRKELGKAGRQRQSRLSSSTSNPMRPTCGTRSMRKLVQQYVDQLDPVFEENGVPREPCGWPATETAVCPAFPRCH